MVDVAVDGFGGELVLRVLGYLVYPESRGAAVVVLPSPVFTPPSGVSSTWSSSSVPYIHLIEVRGDFAVADFDTQPEAQAELESDPSDPSWRRSCWGRRRADPGPGL